MYRFLNLFIFIFLLGTSLQATQCIPDCEFQTDWTLEVRGAYFYLPGSEIKKKISRSWIDYQVETAKRIHPFIELFGGVYWTTKDTTLKDRCGPYHHRFRTKSQMSVIPVTLGIKAIYPIAPFVDIYAGAGICESFLKIKNRCQEKHLSYEGLSSPPYKRTIIKNCLGGLLKAGIQIALSPSTFLDFFTDYYMQTFKFPKHDRRQVFNHELDCSGFKFGAGFGVYF